MSHSRVGRNGRLLVTHEAERSNIHDTPTKTAKTLGIVSQRMGR